MTLGYFTLFGLGTTLALIGTPTKQFQSLSQTEC
jgi:hypothetical protein